MKFIAAFLLACVAMSAAKPLTDMEWRAEYGRYGSILPMGYYPSLQKYRMSFPLDIASPYLAKANFDPEFFYNTYGFYPEH